MSHKSNDSPHDDATLNTPEPHAANNDTALNRIGDDPTRTDRFHATPTGMTGGRDDSPESLFPSRVFLYSG